jgi:hypothetical protein
MFLSFSKKIGVIIKAKQFQMLVLELSCTHIFVHIQKYKPLPSHANPRRVLTLIITSGSMTTPRPTLRCAIHITQPTQQLMNLWN